MALSSGQPRSMMGLVNKPLGKSADVSAWRGEDLMDQYQKILASFQAHSQDKVLTADSLYEVLHELQPTFTKPMVSQLFLAVDTSGDGVVEMRELLDYLFDIDELVDACVQSEGLVDLRVQVRILPNLNEATGALAWSEEGVTIQDRKYAFPRPVISPVGRLGGVNDVILPELLDYWLIKAVDTVLLVHGGGDAAFGVRERLAAGDVQADLGIAPQIVDACLKQMSAYGEIAGTIEDGVHNWILTASAVEFNADSCVDLLTERAPIIRDGHGFPSDANAIRIASMSDYLDFYDKAHVGSGSRREYYSHVMVYFTLHIWCNDIANLLGLNTDDSKEVYSKVSFSVIDMANAELPQVRSELNLFKEEAELAHERHSKRKRYSPIKRSDGAVDFVRFLSAFCLTGNSLLGMFFCLPQDTESQPQNAFVCSLAEALAHIQVPLKPCIQAGTVLPYSNALRAAMKAYERAKKLLNETPKEVGAKSQYWPLRNCQANSAANRLQIIKDLKSLKC